MRNINVSRENLIIFLLTCFCWIVSFALGYWFLLEGIGKVFFNNDENSKVHAEVLILRGKKRVLESLSDQELSEFSAKAVAALPEEKSFPGLLSGLETLAQSNGARVTGFDTSPGLVTQDKGKKLTQNKNISVSEGTEKLPNKLMVLPAKVELEASPVALISLLKQLNQASRLVIVDSVSYSEKSGFGAQATNVVLTLNVYFRERDDTRILDIQPLNEEEKILVTKVDAFNRFFLTGDEFEIKTDPFAPVAPQSGSTP